MNLIHAHFNISAREIGAKLVACVRHFGYSSGLTPGLDSVHPRKQRFQSGYNVVVWMGENDTKTISVDADLFENGAKLFVRKRNSVDRALFTLSNGIVWTGPYLHYLFKIEIAD